MEQKPEMVSTMGIIMIVSGIINIIWGIGVSIAFIVTVVGILCVPLSLIPIGIGIYEIIQGANITGDKPVKNVTLVGILEIVSILWGNLISLIAGILVLVFYNDEQVKAYFDSLIQS